MEGKDLTDFIQGLEKCDYRDGQLLYDIEGVFHNYCLHEIFEKINLEAEDIEKELYNIVMQIPIMKKISIVLDVDFAKIIGCYMHDRDKYIGKMKSKFSDDAMNYIVRGLYECEEYDNYEKFKEKLNSIRNNVIKSNLSEIEKYAICSACSVWMHSAHYWFNDSLLFKTETKALISDKDKEKIKDIVKSDGLSASISMIGLAIVAGVVSGPVGWAALVGIGAEAAVTSAITAIEIYNKDKKNKN